MNIHHKAKLYNYFDVDAIREHEERIPVTFLVSSFTLGSDISLLQYIQGVEGDEMPLSTTNTSHYYHDNNNVGSTDERAGAGRNSLEDDPHASEPHQTDVHVHATTTSTTPLLLEDVKEGQRASLPLWAVMPLFREGYLRVHLPDTFSRHTFKEFKTDPLAPNLAHKSPYFYEVGLHLVRCIHPSTLEGRLLPTQLPRLYQMRYLKILNAAHKKGFDLSDVREKLAEKERLLLDLYLMEKNAYHSWYTSVI